MAFPQTLTNAVDKQTPILAAHLNNLEAKVGVDGSTVPTSLDYLIKHPSSLEPGHKHYKLWSADGSSTALVTDNAGNVSITTKLEVSGTVQMTGFKLTTSPTSGYVLTSDASGVGTWQPPGAGSECGWTDDGTVVRLTTSTDSVGIGTANPAAKLEVRGGIRAGANGTEFQVSTAGDITAGTYNGITITPGTGTLTLNTKTFTLSNSLTLAGADGKTVNFGANNLTFSTTGDCTLTIPGSGTVALGTGATNYLARWTGTNTLSTGVVYDNGTNVGIGTTNVGSYKLNVNGTVNTGALTATSFNGNIITSGSGTLTLNSKTLTINNSLTFSGSDGKTINFGSNDLTFSTSAACTLTIPASGTVALGTGASNYLARWTGANSLSTGVVYDNGTNVGIGTTDVSTYKLNINGAINATSYYLNGAPFSGGGPNPGTLTGQTLYWNGSAWTASSNLFNNNTNVGIGTTTPSDAKLQVAGTGKFEGALTVAAGGITVTGNSTIAGTLGSLTGLTSSGTITFSGLSSGGLVKAGSGTGTLTLATPATDYIAGGVGAANQVAYFTGQGVLSGSNNLYFNGTNVGIGTTDVSTYRLNVDGTVNAGALTATSFNGNIITSGSGTLTLNSKTLTVNNSLTFTGSDGKTINFGANNLTFSTSAACTLTIPTSGTVALGTGTSNYLTRWTGTNSLSTGVVYDNGTNVGIGTTDVSTYKLNVNGTINTTGYYLNGVPFTSGGGTQAKILIQTGLNVAANSSQQFNLTGFLNRGLGHYLKMEETGGLVTGTYDVEIYEEDTFTTLLYRAQGIIPTTSYEDWLPFWVEDADNTQELHLKIYNHDSSRQGTYKITLKAEMFA